MSKNFKPVCSITPGVTESLMRIEAANEKVVLLLVNPTVLASLRETAKLYTTHYSTMMSVCYFWKERCPACLSKVTFRIGSRNLLKLLVELKPLSSKYSFRP